MGSRTAFVLPSSTRRRDPGSSLIDEEHQEFVETPSCRNRASRGVITGIALGACLWAGILAAFGVIKL